MTKHLTHFIKHNYHPEPRHTHAGHPPTHVIPWLALSHEVLTKCEPRNPGVCLFLTSTPNKKTTNVKTHVIPWLDHGTQVLSYNKLFKSSYKSRHNGLYFSIKSFFQFRFQSFNLFSRRIASFALSCRSK